MAATLAFGLLGAFAAYQITQFSSERRSPPPSPLEDQDTLTGPQPVMTG
jgi:hypothetical protein